MKDKIHNLIVDCRDRVMVNGKVEYTEQYYVDKIIELIETQIDKKIQHVNKVLNDPRITLQGYHNMKGKKEAFEEIKELLK
ncbi:MAG: hypothetical protein K0S93_82 [Nitrososphaeraceae archaeon]|jgi:hypothetical protein|nr:hypothetical protein [Nitrososphaeraceae archaeon]